MPARRLLGFGGMAAPFPHHYATTVRRNGHARATLEAPPRTTLQGGAPPEFGGRAEDWSPEHLLLAAVGLCLETTFDALAARDGLAVETWSVSVDGVVDRTPIGLAFTSITARIEITVAVEEVERARAVAHRARHCLVSSSLSVPVEVVAIVTGPDQARRTA